MVHGGEYGPPLAVPVAAEDTPGRAATPGKRKREDIDKPESPEYRMKTLERVVEEQAAEHARSVDELRRKDEKIRDLEWVLRETRQFLSEYKEMHSRPIAQLGIA